MKPKGRYRVLLLCKKCEKVFNGTPLMSYNSAIKWYHNTLIMCADTCTNEGCDELVVAEIQDMEKPKDESK